MNKIFLEAAFVEFTANHLWGLLRRLYGRYLSPRCARCVVPSAHSPLDAAGFCEDCVQNRVTPKPPSTVGPGALDDFLRGFEGKGKDFDALLLFSGGKDSAFLLHRLRTEFPKLRVATMLVDNGFMSPVALENAQKVLAKFGVTHFHHRLPAGFVHKVFRYTLTHLELQKGYSIVDLMDGAMSFESGMNAAAEKSIPLVLTGLSRQQMQANLGVDGFELPMGRGQKTFKDLVGLPLTDFLTAEDMKNFWDPARGPAERIPRFIFPFGAWDPEESFVQSEVDRLGLIPRRRSSPLLTNNALIPVIGMAEVARFGYSCWEAEFAASIREGKSDRTYWRNIFEMLEFSTKSGKFINKGVIETLARLNLTKQDIGIPS